jgi:glycosyltransferase involved in cell wall biosynthesis
MRSKLRYPGGLLLVCEFAARHPGNFLALQFAVARSARDRLGLRPVFVLPERAKRRYWVPQIDEAGFECQFVPASARHCSASLLQIARRARARIVHSHFTWLDLESLYAGHKTGAAVIWHVHNGLFGYPVKQRLSDLVKARVLSRGCDAVIAVSDQVARDLLLRGFPARKVSVVLNALWLERLEHPRRGRAETRALLGVEADALVVLCFGWPPVVKGADLLVEAVSRIQRVGRNRPLKVVLVGEQGPLEQFLQQRFGALPGWLCTIPPVDDVAALFDAADVFVSAARTEGFCFAVGEAMACGLPVVGSDIPGTAHFWAAPGFVRYPVDDPDALATRLCELARDNARAELAQGNRCWAHKQLGPDRYVDEMMNCYGRVLAARSA